MPTGCAAWCDGVRPVPEKPLEGQESVWDYPRPPRLEAFAGLLTVELGGEVIASAERGWRVLETSHPPTYYLPRSAFRPDALRAAPGGSWCEFKGRARYFDLVSTAKTARKAAWNYPDPAPGFEAISDAIAVMAGLVDRCTVNGETVVPQAGGFYGGWITSTVAGPFKGGPGTHGW